MDLRWGRQALLGQVGLGKDVSEDSGFLAFRMCEGKEAWKGKERSVKDARKINLSSLGSEESLRLLDGGVEWFREIKLAK